MTHSFSEFLNCGKFQKIKRGKFQEYAQAMELLKKAYYPNAAANGNETQRRNIALLSDATFADGILKAVIYQTNANHRGCDENQHKNTFLFR